MGGQERSAADSSGHWTPAAAGCAPVGIAEAAAATAPGGWSGWSG